MKQATLAPHFSIWSLLPNWPLLIWMVVATLILGLLGGFSTPELIVSFNAGFGRALGEFALILLPSFTLAAVMHRSRIGSASRIAVAASPLAGAGMVCPDTAYAALSPIAGGRRLDVAFGSYAGFKLLYPAGPLIVATGLGVKDDSLLFYGIALLFPVWAVGVLWARMLGQSQADAINPPTTTSLRSTALAFLPFVLLAMLLVLGSIFDFSKVVILDFITNPKGALLAAAAVALTRISREERRDCLDSAIGRTSTLLLVIGIASAFGAILTKVVPLDLIIPSNAGLLGIIGLFALTAFFKLAQGSSMATFAAVAPVAAPLVVSMEISPAAAVFAICAGSFVAILPNDSFYWLVRKDALQHDGDARSLSILAIGATLQALTCLGIVLFGVVAGWLV